MGLVATFENQPLAMCSMTHNSAKQHRIAMGEVSKYAEENCASEKCIDFETLCHVLISLII